MSEVLFRFMVLRPPVGPEPGQAEPLMLSGPSVLVDKILAAGDDSAKIKALVDGFAFGAESTSDLAKLAAGQKLAAATERLRQARALAPDTVRAVVAEIYGSNPSAEVASQGWQKARIAIADTLLARRLSGGKHGREGDSSTLEIALRIMAVVEQSTNGSLDDQALMALLQRPILAPDFSALGAKLTGPKPAVPAPPTTTVKPSEIAAIKDSQIAKSLADVVRIPASALDSVPDGAAPKPPRTRQSGQTPAVVVRGQAATAGGEGKLIVDLAGAVPTKRVLTRQGADGLSAPTRETLAKLGIEPVGKSVGEIYSAILQVRRSETDGALNAMIPVNYGAALAGFNSLILFGPIVFGDPRLTSPVPTSHGAIQSVGMGSLFVVKQQLVGYEESEISHIENVMPGEAKRREHRRRNVVEDYFETETDKTTEDERDQQSTERFEVSTEVQETLKEDFEFQAGLRVDASYGPTIQIGFDTGVRFATSREVAEQRASSFSQEVVDRAVSRVSERVREKRSRMTREEIEEVAEHRLEGASGTNGVRGVFQWVDKIYRAQSYRYDERKIFDFAIPEPGAFLYRALQLDLAVQEGIPPPPEFVNRSGEPLTADDINESDYGYYSAIFQAADAIAPPPQPTRVISDSITFEGGTGDSPHGIAKSKKIAIPDGFEANHVAVLSVHAASQVVVTVAHHIFGFDNVSGVRETGISLDGSELVGNIEIGAVAPGPNLVLVSVHLSCRLTQHAMQQWRLDTFSALQQAHARLVSAYQERLQARAIAAGVTGGAGTRRLGRSVVIEELKKACVTLLTYQHFDLFNAIQLDASGYPQLDLRFAQAQAEYARFFEQAFEWENLNFVLYPYFWGRKSEWLNKFVFNTTDAEVAELVRSGAARVVVAVRPGFESAVVHFQETGKVWSGGNIPDIHSAEYFDIAEEIRARTDAMAGDPVPVGEPWLVRVPTSLVYLRDADAALPTWEQDDAGDWRPGPA